MSFMSWWTHLMGLLPYEDSAPSDWTLLLVGTLPMAALTLGLTLLWPWSWWLSAVLVVLIASLVRYGPWFRRPEGYHLNAVIGWIAGMILHVVIRRGW